MVDVALASQFEAHQQDRRRILKECETSPYILLNIPIMMVSANEGQVTILVWIKRPALNRTAFMMENEPMARQCAAQKPSGQQHRLHVPHTSSLLQRWDRSRPHAGTICVDVEQRSASPCVKCGRRHVDQTRSPPSNPIVRWTRVGYLEYIGSLASGTVYTTQPTSIARIPVDQQGHGRQLAAAVRLRTVRSATERRKYTTCVGWACSCRCSTTVDWKHAHAIHVNAISIWTSRCIASTKQQISSIAKACQLLGGITLKSTVV